MDGKKISEINHQTICNAAGAIKAMGTNSKSLVTDGCYSHCGKVAKSVVRVKVVSVTYLSVNKAFGTVSHGSKLRKCSLAKVTSK